MIIRKTHSPGSLIITKSLYPILILLYLALVVDIKRSPGLLRYESLLSSYLPDKLYQSSLKPHFPGIFLICSQGNFIHSSRGFKYHLMLMTLKFTSLALLSKPQICISESQPTYPLRCSPGNTSLTCLKSKSSSPLPIPHSKLFGPAVFFISVNDSL